MRKERKLADKLIYKMLPTIVADGLRYIFCDGVRDIYPFSGDFVFSQKYFISGFNGYFCLEPI